MTERRGRRRAAAIAYDPGDRAPRVLAQGQGPEAERIIALAKQAGVAIVEDAALSALLAASTKAGDEIPPWCWEAAAKILAFVYRKEKADAGRR